MFVHRTTLLGVLLMNTPCGDNASRYTYRCKCAFSIRYGFWKFGPSTVTAKSIRRDDFRGWKSYGHETAPIITTGMQFIRSILKVWPIKHLKGFRPPTILGYRSREIRFCNRVASRSLTVFPYGPGMVRESNTTGVAQRRA